MAGSAEAGDRGGVVCAGFVGLNGCPALRRECEPGVRLAEALSQRAACAGRPVGIEIERIKPGHPQQKGLASLLAPTPTKR